MKLQQYYCNSGSSNSLIYTGFTITRVLIYQIVYTHSLVIIALFPPEVLYYIVFADEMLYGAFQ